MTDNEKDRQIRALTQRVARLTTERDALQQASAATTGVVIDTPVRCTIVGGYRVRVRYRDVSDADRARRRQAITRVVAGALVRHRVGR